MDQPDYTKKSAQRGLGLHLAIATLLGMSSLLVFSVWRRKWPRFYAARTLRRHDLPQLPQSLFGWVAVLYKTTDIDVLEYAGLDAFVFLMFFRAAFAMILRMALIFLVGIGPIRWYYTGKYEEDDGEDWFRSSDESRHPVPHSPALFDNFNWVYVVFTYVFTILCTRTLQNYTAKVVRVRQEYLGHQNSITDRTLRISGIPARLRSKHALVEYMSMAKGEPKSVVLCYDWSTLDQLFVERKKLIRKLEFYWAQYLGPTFIVDFENREFPRTRQDIFDIASDRGPQRSGAGAKPRRRPTGRLGFLGIMGPKVDLIDHYTNELEVIDTQIKAERSRTNLGTTSNAFVTMDSVISCQMAAQTVFSPRPHRMVTHLAPAPQDVIWKFTYLKSFQRSTRVYLVTLVFLLTTIFLSLPVSYLASLLDMDSIEKFMPWLARLLKKSPWLETFVTQVLTTYIFTLFNILVPYFYAYLSYQQGHISQEDVELSTLSKNFFFVFVNLFLVFTIAQNYLSLLRDTTQIAVDLAGALKRLSTFYTNLLVFQGFGILPTRLLQAGAILQIPFVVAHAKTARDHHLLYKPAALNYGILLPTSILFFIIVMMYSVLSGRILVFGAVYFLVGYYVFKYQFIYSMVHTQHSTGRLWTLITRRIFFGIGLFQLAMIGVLVLQSAYTLATLIIPLIMYVAATWYDFEKFSEPLLRFIALDAVYSATSADDISHGSRDSNTDYDNPIEAELNASSSQAAWLESLENEEEGNATENTENNIAQVSHDGRRNASFSFTGHGDSEDESQDDETSRLLIGRLRHRISRTLDEDREHNQRYVNNNSVSSLDGPWIGLEGTECVVATPRGPLRKKLSFDGWE